MVCSIALIGSLEGSWARLLSEQRVLAAFGQPLIVVTTAPLKNLELGVQLATPLLGNCALAMLQAGLAASPREEVLVIDADAPRPSDEALALLATTDSQDLAVLFTAGPVVSLFPGRYQRKCLKVFSRALLAGQTDLGTVLAPMKITKIVDNFRK